MKLLLATVCVLLMTLAYSANSLKLDDTDDFDEDEILDAIEDVEDEDVDSDAAEIPEMQEDPASTFRRRRLGYRAVYRKIYSSTYVFGRRRGTARRRSSATKWVAKCPGCVNSGLSPKEIKNFSASCLEAHNKLRRRHVDTPDLVWSAELADHALAYAKKLGDSLFAKNKYNLVHDGNRGFEGENLWFNWYGLKPRSQWKYFTCDRIVKDWYNEIKDWNFQKGESKGAGKVRHFTQIVWQATTKVGMGVHLTFIPWKGKSLPYVFAVGRYQPPGNGGGVYQENVGLLKVLNCPKKITDGACPTSGSLWIGLYKTRKTLDECQRHCRAYKGCADFVFGTGKHAGKCGMYKAGCKPNAALKDLAMYTVAHCSKAKAGDEPYNTSDYEWVNDDKEF